MRKLCPEPIETYSLVLWFISMATYSPGEPDTASLFDTLRTGPSILRDGAKTPFETAFQASSG